MQKQLNLYNTNRHIILSNIVIIVMVYLSNPAYLLEKNIYFLSFHLKILHASISAFDLFYYLIIAITLKFEIKFIYLGNKIN